MITTQFSLSSFPGLDELFRINDIFSNTISKSAFSNLGNANYNLNFFNNNYCSSHIYENYEKGKPLQTTKATRGFGSVIEWLHYYVIIDDFFELENFITQNEFLTIYLIEAIDEIKKLFGDIDLSLNLLKIYDDSYSEQLVINIETNKSIKESFELLDKFDKNWWLRQIPHTKNLLSIDIVYK